MPQAYIDRLSDLGLVERHGVIRSLSRVARVMFREAAQNGTDIIPKDFSILSEALKVVPLPFSTLSSPAGYESLVLVERAPKLAMQDSQNCVDVTLKYEHVLEGSNQYLRNPTGQPGKPGVLFGKGKCSVVEKSTNFYRPNGNESADRVQVLVGHTFPPWDPITQVIDPGYPNTVIQGGEITIPFPQANFHLEGVLDVNNPWDVADQYIACINDVDWLGKPRLTWLCSEVAWEVIGVGGASGQAPLDVDKQRYKFTFEFQYNIDTWDPTVVFNDHRTGRPPAGVIKANLVNPNPTSPEATASPQVLSFTTNPLKPVRDVRIPIPLNNYVLPIGPNIQPAGMWTVPALKRVDFEDLFAANFDGFLMRMFA